MKRLQEKCWAKKYFQIIISGMRKALYVAIFLCQYSLSFFNTFWFKLKSRCFLRSLWNVRKHFAIETGSLVADGHFFRRIMWRIKISRINCLQKRVYPRTHIEYSFNKKYNKRIEYEYVFCIELQIISYKKWYLIQ